jgi:hypothetical protein
MSALAQDESRPGRTIPDQAVENLLQLWILTVALMVASAVVVPPLVRDALKGPHQIGLLALAFPMAGPGLLLWAFRRTWRIRKFGASTLHLGTLSVMPGGDLVAVIHVDRPVSGGRTMRLRLRCIRRSRWIGKRGTATSESVPWQQSQDLDHVPGNRDGSDIPVRFHLPADAQAATGFDWSREILWRLEARSKSGLVSYYARFQVPVGVVTVEEATPEPLLQAQPLRVAASDPRARLSEPGIACQPLDGGGLHLHLAAARRQPVVPSVVGLIFTGIAVALFILPKHDVMWIVTFVFGSFLLLPGVLFDYIAIYLWLVSQDVKVRRDSLVMERRALFFHWGRTFTVPEIAEITCKQDGNSGMTTFHGIQLKARDGKTVWLASSISQADYAAWLTDEIQDALGPAPELRRD